MVEAHGLAECRQAVAAERRLAAVAPRFLHEPRFVEQLVAVEHLLFVPGTAGDAEAQLQPFLAAERAVRLGQLFALRPFLQERQDGAVENLRTALAPVLPGKET